MGVVIGLDIGGSTTKTVALRGKTVIGYQVVTANDVVASAYGALGKFLNHHRLSPKDLDCVMVTGVGSTYLYRPFARCPDGQGRRIYLDRPGRLIHGGLGQGGGGQHGHRNRLCSGGRRRGQAFDRLGCGRRHLAGTVPLFA